MSKLIQKMVLVVAILLGGFGNILLAQSKVEEGLTKAGVYFEKGEINNALALLKALEGEKFDNERLKVQLYRQMTICYIFLNQDDSTDVATNLKLAEESYLKLLKTNNIYEPDSNDVVDYLRFTEQFSSNPKLLINVKVGMNTSFVDVLQYYSIGNLSDSIYDLNKAIPYKAKYTNLTAGVHLDWNFAPRFNWVAGGSYTLRSYEYEEVLQLGEPFTLSFTEQQQWIDLSTALKYDMGKNKMIVPYVFGGFAYHRLLHSNYKSIKRTHAELPTLYDLSVIGGAADGSRSVATLKDTRWVNNWSLIGGVGLKWRVIGKHYLTVEGQYGRMLRPINNVENRYNSSSSTEWNYAFGYIDNDIRLDNVSLMIGFAYAIYNPKMNKKI